MEYKKCTKCNNFYPIDFFNKRKHGKNGLDAFCKKCESIRQKNYSKTKKGVIKSIYSGQNNSSIRRKHPMPNYTLCELRNWAFRQKIFDLLYDNWVKSDYKKSLKPSFDRINDNLPYSLDNIQITTWAENNLKANIHKRLGILKLANPLKKIKGTDVDTNEVIYFNSMMDAERHGFNRQCIRKCCNNIQKYHKKYFWEWA